jgi:HSP20 family protein
MFTGETVLTQEKPRRKRAAPEKKEPVQIIPRQRPPSMLEPSRPSDLWMDFDRAFERFRKDFENMLWPSEGAMEREYPMMMRELETRMPAIDLEDQGDRYLLTADVPGFKKDEIEVNVWDGQIEICGTKESKRGEERKGYVRRERSSESFYRQMVLPEEVKVEDAEANLQNGILELVLPKKVPKKKKKVQVK